MSLLSGFLSLGADTNKVKDLDTDEGVISDLLPELTLNMEDGELIALKKQYIKTWEPVANELSKLQKDNENYWMGQQFADGSKEGHALVDNVIFEAFETFLPIATRPKADPVVDPIPKNSDNQVALAVRERLTNLVDDLSYNLKLKQVTRYWGLHFLGAMKVGFSMKNDDITCYPVRAQKLILDPEATISECEYTGEYIGEYRTDSASNLISRFPSKKAFIEAKVNKNLGTKIQYIEWWHDDYIFFTLDDEVLSKSKNPHFNYDSKETQVTTDEMGNEIPSEVDIPGNNHFKAPKKPYYFLSIFNLGKRPFDDTNLIKQNLPLQDLINKRLRQIDINADNANGGMIVSGDYWTKEQAALIPKALRGGSAIWQPSGSVNDGVKRDTGAPLPNFVYESLIDYRSELRNIFGTRGSSPQGTINEQTVRGKIEIKGQDSDRIGGGISVYLEQLSDKIFNYFVQLMYVYDENPPQGKVKVGVKEGSMIPKDPVTQRNEAIDLWGQKALDPITFFEKLEFPNPQESAKQLFLWLSDPIQLFPDLAQAQQEQMMAQQQAMAEDQQMQQMTAEQQQMQQSEQSQQQSSQEHERELEKIQVNNLTKSYGK